MHCSVTVVVCVCVCVCVCVRFDFPNSNELVKKTYGLPQRCNLLIYIVFIYVKQPLREAIYRIRVAAVLAHLLAILLALTGVRAYIH